MDSIWNRGKEEFNTPTRTRTVRKVGTWDWCEEDKWRSFEGRKKEIGETCTERNLTFDRENPFGWGENGDGFNVEVAAGAHGGGEVHGEVEPTMPGTRAVLSPAHSWSPAPGPPEGLQSQSPWSPAQWSQFSRSLLLTLSIVVFGVFLVF